jgi:hypothetical protein
VLVLATDSGVETFDPTGQDLQFFGPGLPGVELTADLLRGERPPD